MTSYDPAIREQLSALYGDLSKHSSYQNIPDFVAEALDYRVEISEEWRGDRVRLRYIESRLPPLPLQQWCDFGANTGYFALTLAHRYPQCRFLAIEANPNHARFITTIRNLFEIANADVMAESIEIDSLSQVPPQDVMLHLNVLHHAGADFDKGRVANKDDFVTYAEDYLRRLRARTRTLVLQIGSNLWGDKSRPIIDHRDDAAKLVLFADILARSGWCVDDIAYAAKDGDSAIAYRALERELTSALSTTPSRVPLASLNAALAPFNLPRHVGEFYRRPLFICSNTGAFERIAI